MLTQTLTLILTLIPILAPTLTQTEEKHYFASKGKITTSFYHQYLVPFIYHSGTNQFRLVTLTGIVY